MGDFRGIAFEIAGCLRQLPGCDHWGIAPGTGRSVGLIVTTDLTRLRPWFEPGFACGVDLNGLSRFGANRHGINCAGYLVPRGRSALEYVALVHEPQSRGMDGRAGRSVRVRVCVFAWVSIQANLIARCIGWGRL